MFFSLFPCVCVLSCASLAQRLLPFQIFSIILHLFFHVFCFFFLIIAFDVLLGKMRFSFYIDILQRSMIRARTKQKKKKKIIWKRTKNDKKYYYRIKCCETEKVRVVFLYWLPCLLRMSRPLPDPEEEEKLKKNAAKIQCVELKDRSSKSLLANVLDIDDDIRCNHNCTAFNQQSSIYRNMYRCVPWPFFVKYSITFMSILLCVYGLRNQQTRKLGNDK